MAAAENAARMASPGGVSMYQMPGVPRPSAEKIPASLAVNCRAANFIRHFPAFHFRPAAHPFSMPLGKSKTANNDSAGSNLFLKNVLDPAQSS